MITFESLFITSIVTLDQKSRRKENYTELQMISIVLFQFIRDW